MTTITIGGKVVIVNSNTPMICDGLSALEFVSNIGYEHNCQNKRPYKEDNVRFEAAFKELLDSEYLTLIKTLSE